MSQGGNPPVQQAVSVRAFGGDPREFAGDLLVYLVEEDIPHLAAEAPRSLHRALQQGWAAGDFKGRKEETLLVYPGLLDRGDEPPVQARRVLFTGLGKQDDDIHVVEKIEIDMLDREIDLLPIVVAQPGNSEDATRLLACCGQHECGHR